MRKFLFALSVALIFTAALASFSSLPVHSIEINQVASASPTMTVTSLATSDPTIVATIESTEQMYVLMPPRSGNILDTAYDGLIGMASAPVSVANFVVEANFHNPSSEGVWSYGFLFRNHPEGSYRLSVTSDGDWVFSYRRDNQTLYSEEGTLTNFDTSEGGSNELRLIVDGNGAHFFVNDEEVEVFDVSANTLMGNVAVITTVPSADEEGVAITSYDNFTVWSIGLVPTFTPTALAQTGFVAQAGRNYGELELGAGQTWTYEGQAGEVLNIWVNADVPYRSENGIDPTGLDTFLIVRSPSGEVLATLDDNEAGDTDSAYQNLVLPEDGTYEFEVRSWEDSSAGGYTLIIDSSTDNFATPTSTPQP
jgi:hypothetical protein